MTFTGFANVVGLWGLLSLPIILALHLLRQRRKQYITSNLGLWSFLEEEVRGSQLQRLPWSWLLFLHLLIALLLSLAWAQPQVVMTMPVQDGRHQIIILDISASMEARDVVPSRYARAQIQAASYLSELGPSDVATVLAFDNRVHWVGDTRQDDVTNLLTRVSNLRPGGLGSQGLSGALAVAVATLDQELPGSIHILTDATYPQPDIEGIPADLRWHVYGQRGFNQAVIDLSARPIGPGEIQVFARIGNFGDEPANRIVTLLADGEPIDSTPLEIEPGSLVSQLWTLRGQPTAVTVMLAGGDDLSLDDTASLGLRYGRNIRVGLVAAEPEPLRRAFEAIPGVDLRLLQPDEYLPGLPFDLVVFRQTLPSVWPAGTVLVVDPPQGEALLPLAEAQTVTAAAVPTAHSLLDNLDFSGVRWSRVWTVEPGLEDFRPLLQADDLPLLLHGQSGAGNIYVLLPDLGSSNLTRHPAFPIFLANLVQLVAGTDLPTAIRAGDPLLLPGRQTYPLIQLHSPEGEVIELATERPDIWTETRQPGVYYLDLTDRDGDRQRYAVGVNAGSLEESDISPGQWAQQSQLADQVSETQDARQVDLMPWLLFLVILLLVLEARLAWR